MGMMEKLSVEVPADIAEAMRARVRSGRYASESEAVAAALAAFDDEDDDLDAWLRSEVVPAVDEIRSGTATLLTSDEVRDRLGIRR